jgi:predicted nucleic acid-binding protein
LKRVVFLDTGVLGAVVHTRASECQKWLRDLLAAGVHVCVAEICDYELRRKLEHLRSSKQLANLDALKQSLTYVALDTPSMLEAAKLWAQARQMGHPTAAPEALDGDVILSAQVRLNVARDDKVTVATTNPEDVGRFVPADCWLRISAEA